MIAAEHDAESATFASLEPLASSIPRSYSWYEANRRRRTVRTLPRSSAPHAMSLSPSKSVHPRSLDVVGAPDAQQKIVVLAKSAKTSHLAAEAVCPRVFQGASVQAFHEPAHHVSTMFSLGAPPAAN